MKKLKHKEIKGPDGSGSVWQSLYSQPSVEWRNKGINEWINKGFVSHVAPDLNWLRI